MRATGDSSVEPAELTKGFKPAKKFRPPARLLLKEMIGGLNESGQWVNVSDGGHVENLGAFELLRRRCQIVIVGEGEADPTGTFPGLSTLMRLASIDLGIEIVFPDQCLERLIIPNKENRPKDETDQERTLLQRHHAVAQIKYPATEDFDAEIGYLLYVRSSLRGNEDQIIKSYQAQHASFPHESTGDQMFNEGQFEAYRRLGEKMMRDALGELGQLVHDGAQETRGLLKSLASWKPTVRQEASDENA
jgi:hypothetical protein